MGCSGCGSANIISGSLSARKPSSKPKVTQKVKGAASNGIIKSKKRLAREKALAEVAKANKEAAASTSLKEAAESTK